MDFSDIFDEHDERKRREAEEGVNADVKEMARRRGNAARLHSHLEAVVVPILHAACRQLTDRGIDGLLEAVQVCSAAPELAMGAQIVHRDTGGAVTSIARIVYRGECDTMEILFEMYGSGRFASIKATETLSIGSCTAECVTARTRAFLRAVVA